MPEVLLRVWLALRGTAAGHRAAIITVLAELQHERLWAWTLLGADTWGRFRECVEVDGATWHVVVAGLSPGCWWRTTTTASPTPCSQRWAAGCDRPSGGALLLGAEYTVRRAVLSSRSGQSSPRPAVKWRIC